MIRMGSVLLFGSDGWWIRMDRWYVCSQYDMFVLFFPITKPAVMAGRVMWVVWFGSSWVDELWEGSLGSGAFRVVNWVWFWLLIEWSLGGGVSSARMCSSSAVAIVWVAVD